MSFLSKIGTGFKDVFKWLASPKAQAIIQTGEAAVLAVDPALGGIITLANSWISKAITTESLAAAAASQTGSGAQKAAAVIQAMGPEIAQYFPNATAAEVTNANNAIVAFLNAFETTPASANPVPPAAKS